MGAFHAGLGQVGDGGTDVVGQHALEPPAVAALEEQLAEAAEEHARFFHARAFYPCAGRLARGWALPANSRAASPRAIAAPSMSAAVVWRESEKRSTPVRSGRPMAFKVGLRPAVREAQAEPAEASTPRASSACKSGSAGKPG